jgi:predicted dehydrogenase
MMLTQIEHFLDVITSESESKVTVDDGINALRVADALIRSIETNSWQAV